MTNPARGEVGFEADGKQYVLKYGTNALVSLERRLGVKVRELGAVLSDPTLEQVVAVFAAGLQAHHKGITEEETGDVIDAAGGLASAVDLMKEALELAFPPGEATEGEAQAEAAS